LQELPKDVIRKCNSKIDYDGVDGLINLISIG